MKDIYITTFYRTENYGSNLQAIGLVKAFEKYGCNATMLREFRVNSVFLKHPSLLFARFYNRLNMKKRLEFFKPVPYEFSQERLERLEQFWQDNYKEISIYNSSSWSQIVQSKSGFVAGSDIIWQPARGYPAKLFLDFAVVYNLPCFSYASSLGSKTLPKKFHHAYKKYLGHYRYIGVREEAAKRLLEPIVKKPITKVVDPTLLLDANDWDEFAQRAVIDIDISDSGYILCYFVMNDSRYWEYVDKAKRCLNKQIIILPMHEDDERQSDSVITNGTPYEFVWLVKHADSVITDSYHACCFAMQYEVDFYLIRRSRKAEDDKYDDFLSRYQLGDRIVNPESEFETLPRTDYAVAKAQLLKDRTSSSLFLEKIVDSLQ